ncbi:MAG: hypothetical protein KA956_13310 [Pyrinomonadaceae bacterium]|nr:hypothetical protein [Acidobacteriota bacterium]MBK7932421.1 hypothetical protein [Acidobacteriota bacterium]MBP7377446.1 hypothetical protein [Pyrinomonadaceae bacterium]
MRKFIFGMIAVLGVHIVFVAFFATLDTMESTRNDRSLAKPNALPAAGEPVLSNEIVVAGGTTPEGPAETPAADRRTARRPAAIAAVERRTPNAGPRAARTVKPQPKFVAPVYRSAAYTVERTEFPQTVTFTAADDKRSEYAAKTEKAARPDKRSFLAKVGSIIKKPYDGLKAVASWLR